MEHGAGKLPNVEISAYNAELRDAQGFVGDRASNRAFRAILDDWRKKLKRVADDPLGEKATEEIGKKKLDKILAGDDLEAAGLVQGAIEDFATELAAVTSRFLRTEAWKGVERIAVGGGLRGSRVGELAIGRASVQLKSEKHAVDLVPIAHDPDDAGLIGGVYLAPAWVYKGFDAIVAVDIGGTSFRAGIVTTPKDLSKAAVHTREVWRHGDDEPKRDAAIERLAAMVQIAIKTAKKEGLKLAPMIGVGVPGIVRSDGTIDRGGQNLPGNWESKKFNLASELIHRIPEIGGHATQVIVHNDAVVQGLSQIPQMRDVKRWGVLTIGTGLGNAAFRNFE